VTRFVFLWGGGLCACALLLGLVAKVVFDADEFVRVGLLVAGAAFAPAVLLVFVRLRRVWLSPLDPEVDLSESEEWERMRRRRFAKYRRLMRENPPTPRDAT
jgi:hypothetical protein